MARRIRTCKVDGCDRNRDSRGWCSTHMRRWRASHPEVVIVSYQAAHRRVVAHFGSAGQHLCVDCGNPATDWSYNHGDPDELLTRHDRPYSLKLDYYSPRCRSCHTTFDHRVQRTPAPEPLPPRVPSPPHPLSHNQLAEGNA